MPGTPADDAPPDPTPAPVFPEPPPDFRPDARRAFRRMVKELGPTAYRMSTTFDLYLRQHLAEFDPERQVLSDALRWGVPSRIGEHPGRAGYDEFLLDLADKFAADRRVGRDVGWWAVEAWAAAVGKPVGYAAPPPVARPVDVPRPKTGTDPADQQLVMASRLIASAGGLLGGTVGAAAPLLVVTSSAEMATETDAATSVASGVLVLLLAAFTTGLAGAGGAFAGWYMGHGKEAPWAGFAAAFGGAMLTGAITAVMCCVFNPVSFVIVGLSTFAGTYAVAARGGHGAR